MTNQSGVPEWANVQSAGGPVNGYVYVRGTEIATIKALSKIA